MSDKIRSANILPELRVMLFVVFGVGLWLFLVAGIAPTNIGSANATETVVEVADVAQGKVVKD